MAVCLVLIDAYFPVLEVSGMAFEDHRDTSVQSKSQQPVR
jgi:hypothetical protein